MSHTGYWKKVQKDFAEMFGIKDYYVKKGLNEEDFTRYPFIVEVKYGKTFSVKEAMKQCEEYNDSRYPCGDLIPIVCFLRAGTKIKKVAIKVFDLIAVCSNMELQNIPKDTLCEIRADDFINMVKEHLKGV